MEKNSRKLTNKEKETVNSKKVFALSHFLRKWFTILAGIIFIFGGISLGIYVGLWLCFVGGIVQIIEAAKCNPVYSTGIAFGVFKILFASFLGWVSCFIPVYIGVSLIKNV